jgi:hypothetical protein
MKDDVVAFIFTRQGDILADLEVLGQAAVAIPVGSREAWTALGVKAARYLSSLEGIALKHWGQGVDRAITSILNGIHGTDGEDLVALSQNMETIVLPFILDPKVRKLAINAERSHHTILRIGMPKFGSINGHP